jgi:hypothetical protein
MPEKPECFMYEMCGDFSSPYTTTDQFFPVAGSVPGLPQVNIFSTDYFDSLGKNISDLNLPTIPSQQNFVFCSSHKSNIIEVMIRSGQFTKETIKKILQQVIGRALSIENVDTIEVVILEDI